MGIFLDNPIMSVHAHLKGGWKNLLICAGVYAALVFGAMILWAEVDPNHIKGAAEGWTILLMLLQTGLVLLFSVIRVNNAVRSDNSTGMMESHRLMPITGLSACVGYMIGPAAVLMALGAITFVAGIVSSSVAGFSPDRWVVSNFIMLAFLLFACACSVLVGFYSRALFNLIIVLTIISFFSRGLLLYALPVMAVVLLPLSGQTVFSGGRALDLASSAVLFGFVAQAVVGAIMVTAAARKFREPGKPAFSGGLALILLGTWVCLNLIGTLYWHQVAPGFLRYSMGSVTDDRLVVQFTGSAMTTLFLTLLPIAAANRASRELQRARAIRQTADAVSLSEIAATSDAGSVSLDDYTAPLNSTKKERRLITPLTTILICMMFACLLLLIPAFDQHRSDWQSLVNVAISLIAAIANLASLLFIYRARPRGASTAIVLFIFMAWFVPLFIDAVEHSLMNDYQSRNTPWSITSFGPIGTIMSPWGKESQTVAGIACQIVIALALLILALAVGNRRRRMARS